MRRYWDVTLPWSPRLPVWPGDPKPTIERVRNIADGDSANISHISCGVHFATHVDAPVHFHDGAPGVDALPLEVLMGQVTVVHLPDVDAVTASVLEDRVPPEGIDRIIFKTRNSALWDQPDHDFHRDFVAVTPDGARWLVDRGTRLVGVDYLSVEPFGGEGHATHKILLGARVVVVEGLDMRRVPPGTYEMACLPVKIEGADGAPARVVLWRE